MYVRNIDINVHERHDINVHERLSSKTTQIKVKKQLVVRKDIDINVHERHGYKCT